jgi:nitrite reductase (NADH) small subunit
MSADLFVRVSARDIPPREGRALVVGGREIAVFNLGARFLAVDNRCPHKGGPLADGIVSGHTVVCPLHAWKINLETGTVERPAGEAACVRSYPTHTDGDFLLIEAAAHSGDETTVAASMPACSTAAGEPATGDQRQMNPPPVMHANA